MVLFSIIIPHRLMALAWAVGEWMDAASSATDIMQVFR
jgi:hypothetical protein